MKTDNLNILFSGIGGSRLYGINHENSDFDINILFSYNEESYFSCFEKKQSFQKIIEDKDYTYHSAIKFVNLILKGSPNILEWLYTPESFINISTNFWNTIKYYLIENLSKEIYFKSMKGFIFNLLKNYEKHNNLKQLSNVIRMSIQGIEFFKTKYITFPLNSENVTILKNIRNNVYEKNEIDNIINEYYEKFNESYENCSKDFKDDIDLNKINSFISKQIIKIFNSDKEI